MMLRQVVLVLFVIVCGKPLLAQTLPQKKLNDTLYIMAGIEASKQSEGKKALFAQQLKQIQDSGLLYSAVNVKSKAPDFTLKNIKGKTIQLSAEIQKGPVILLWYQGGWNQYCNVTLSYFQAYFSTFKKYGATIVALTPETQEKVTLTKAKNKLTFDIYTDANNTIAKQYGIAYTMSDTLYKEMETQFSLSKFNGNNSAVLPIPAAYVINPNGKIVFAYMDVDFRKRAEPADFLRVLKGMGYPERKP